MKTAVKVNILFEDDNIRIRRGKKRSLIITAKTEPPLRSVIIENARYLPKTGVIIIGNKVSLTVRLDQDRKTLIFAGFWC